MKHYYLTYAHLLFKHFELPEDLILPIIRLMEACSANCMTEYQFRAIMANNDLTDPDAVLRLVEVLRQKSLQRTPMYDAFFHEYPILSPQHFPRDIAIEIVGHIYAALDGSKTHGDQVRRWLVQHHYADQIRLIVRLAEKEDHTFWYWCGWPDLLPKSRFQAKGATKNE